MFTKLEPKSKIETPYTAGVLVFLGWTIIVCGVIAGMVLGRDKWGDVTALFLLYAIAGVISGTTFIGMGKIIELLATIANKEYILKNEEVEVKTESEVTE